MNKMWAGTTSIQKEKAKFDKEKNTILDNLIMS
jgi:hypothetical protein